MVCSTNGKKRINVKQYRRSRPEVFYLFVECVVTKSEIKRTRYSRTELAVFEVSNKIA